MQLEISQELKETVRKQPSIKHIHFDAKGVHHFNVYKHGDDYYARLLSGVLGVKVPDLSSIIVKTLDREQLLTSNGEGNAKAKESEIDVFTDDKKLIEGKNVKEHEEEKKDSNASTGKKNKKK